jgi:N-acetylneuraminic acid mutarotase
MSLEKVGAGIIVQDTGPVGTPAQGWVSVASLGTGRRFLAATADNNGLLYAIGGESSSNTISSVVEQYDPSTDTWSTVASLGTARRELAATADNNGLLYAIGGESSSNNHSSVVEQYDPSTDTWSTVASLGTARRYLAATADNNGLLYAIGGSSSNNAYSSVVEQYDPSTDTWSTVASLGTGRRQLAATVDNNGFDNNGLLYAIGGDSSSNTYSSVVEQSDFNPSLADAYTASGNTLFAVDDPNAIIENRDTGRRENPNVARDGETIAWFSETTARLVRTKET